MKTVRTLGILIAAAGVCLPINAIAQNNYNSGNTPTVFERTRSQDSAAFTFAPDLYRNPPKSLVRRLKSDVARGKTDAMVTLGLIRLHGWALTKEDRLEGWSLLLQAAKGGNAKASLILGASYLRGEHIRSDASKAEYWLTQAIESNDRRVRRDAQKLIASM